MGRRGPAPQPTAMKELAGNPGKRPLNRAEPKPRQRRPKPPAHLTDAARAEWKRLVRILWPTGVLTEAEADVLALYCTAYRQYVDATAEVVRRGMVVASPNGFPIQNPYLSIANQAAKQMRQLLAELGMTPAARTRIQVKPKETADPFDAFLAGAYAATHGDEGDDD